MLINLILPYYTFMGQSCSKPQGWPLVEGPRHRGSANASSMAPSAGPCLPVPVVSWCPAGRIRGLGACASLSGVANGLGPSGRGWGVSAELGGTSCQDPHRCRGQRQTSHWGPSVPAHRRAESMAPAVQPPPSFWALTSSAAKATERAPAPSSSAPTLLPGARLPVRWLV